jgi:hypothetical protein
VIEAVAVDFDGVIHNADQGWQDGVIYGDPIPGSLETLRELMLDHPVFIMTARPDLAPVAQWFSERGFDTIHRETKERWHTKGVLLVTNRKLPAIAYIDDKGVRFTDWKGAAEEVDIIASIMPKGADLLRSRKAVEQTFRSHVLNWMADDLLATSLECSIEFAKGVLWAAERIRMRAMPPQVDDSGEIFYSEES